MNKKQAAIEAVKAVASVIKDMGQVPSGHLYANLMQYMSLDVYQAIIALLVESKLITVKNHLITWVGKA